jgi:hypothetical protein
MVHKEKLVASPLLRGIALVCVLLMTLISVVEVTHAHSGDSSSLCTVCVSAHANAPVATFQALPVLQTVDWVSLQHPVEGKSTSPELQYFIRPPPIA